MKSAITLSLDSDRVGYIHRVSARLGVTKSALVDHLLAAAAGHLTAADLLAWAGPAAAPAVAVDYQRPLKGSEMRVMAVLTVEWAELGQVSGATGQSGRIAFRALNGLVQLGLVQRQDRPTFIRQDTGLPNVSYWRLAG